MLREYNGNRECKGHVLAIQDRKACICSCEYRLVIKRSCSQPSTWVLFQDAQICSFPGCHPIIWKASADLRSNPDPFKQDFQFSLKTGIGFRGWWCLGFILKYTEAEGSRMWLLRASEASIPLDLTRAQLGCRPTQHLWMSGLQLTSAFFTV